MDSLFPEEIFPEGFLYYPDFLTLQEEETLLEVISHTELHAFLFQGFEAKRKVASYGHDYSFEKKSLTEGSAIPAAFNPLIEKVARKISIDKQAFAELLITEYPVGAVINWHRDAFPFEIIAGISLLGDCTFKLRPHEKDKQSRKAIISIPVRRRSLYVMQGPVRYEWQHSISPVKMTRYSITLRTLK